MRATVLLVVLGALGTASAQDLRSVSPELLEGTTIRAKDANFAIDAPGPDWTWKAPLNASAFYCLEPHEPGKARDLFIAQAIARPIELSDAGIAQFLDGFVKGSASKGSLGEMNHELSDLPLAGRSFRFAYTFTKSDGVVLHGTGHVGTALGSTYVLTRISARAGASPEFERFVRSFRLLDANRASKTADEKAGEAASSVCLGSVGLLVAAGLIVLLRKKRR